MSFLIEKLVCRIKKYSLREFKLSDAKTIPLLLVPNPKKPMVAMKSLFGILIDDLFFKLDRREKLSTIWHEKYHQKTTTGIKLFFWLPLRKLFVKRDKKYTIIQLEEFDADRFAVKKTDKSSVLKALRKLMIFENKGWIKSNLKNHPSLQDRIKRIEEM